MTRSLCIYKCSVDGTCKQTISLADLREGALGTYTPLSPIYFIFMRFPANILPNNRLMPPLGLSPDPLAQYHYHKVSVNKALLTKERLATKSTQFE